MPVKTRLVYYLLFGIIKEENGCASAQGNFYDRDQEAFWLSISVIRPWPREEINQTTADLVYRALND